ncbi:uncharacterized protein [Asterias amurensis]|uniref:uncharacterized protein n=1 Tax=Asterias amurensis TaxID=7602 RepID=UPI003AB317FE
MGNQSGTSRLKLTYFKNRSDRDRRHGETRYTSIPSHWYKQSWVPRYKDVYKEIQKLFDIDETISLQLSWNDPERKEAVNFNTDDELFEAIRRMDADNDYLVIDAHVRCADKEEIAGSNANANDGIAGYNPQMKTKAPVKQGIAESNANAKLHEDIFRIASSRDDGFVHLHVKVGLLTPLIWFVVGLTVGVVIASWLFSK